MAAANCRELGSTEAGAAPRTSDQDRPGCLSLPPPPLSAALLSERDGEGGEGSQAWPCPPGCSGPLAAPAPGGPLPPPPLSLAGSCLHQQLPGLGCRHP